MQTRTYAIGAALLTAGLLGGLGSFIVINGQADRTAQCGTGQIAGDLGGPFTLVSETGQTVTDRDVITDPTLLYFGYTFCPDVCPVDVARNVEATELLAQRDLSVRPVFITVDPARDTPAAVAEFTAYFGDTLTGLTGSEDQVRQAAQAYRVFYQVPVQKPGAVDDLYLVNHTVYTYLVTPRRGTIAAFGRELSGAQLADKVACLIDDR